MKIIGGCTLLLAPLLLTRCDIPKDPAGSLDAARQTALQVGVTDNSPFVILQGDRPSGLEVALLEDFAVAQGLRISYRKGSESTLVKMLENRLLHIAIGGFEKGSIWQSKAGFSAPYDSTHVLLIPKGENRLLYELEKTILNHPR
ncbi:transporter substrate-binding domain-containing protein [Neolewinella litorea]|uniref:Transporter substrate-binding domain-containing protein n=1 Tax=Neolewinella litorea TaxID=2562452 RepID=A0A4S4NRJ8_9BACT|nr:transporter substrate-binding domain-containing protein [Neolewinella litorea]THH41827.1 transporter substrate-binding domain-containing protein [Neolewinella litorea]